MDKFLETHKLPTLKQEAIENLNRPKTSNEVESLIKKLPKNKSPGPGGLTGEFYMTFILFFKVYLLIFREREKVRVHKGQKERRARIPSKLHTASEEPGAGLELTSCEITT